MNTPHHLSNSAILIGREQLEKVLDNLANLQLAAATAFAMLNTRLDEVDGDTDREPDCDDELTGDEKDAAWIEWTSLRASQKRGPNIASENEDDEDSDPAEDDGEDVEHDGRELDEGI